MRIAENLHSQNLWPFLDLVMVLTISPVQMRGLDQISRVLAICSPSPELLGHPRAVSESVEDSNCVN